MPEKEKNETDFDLRVAYLYSHYGIEALSVARENMLRYRASEDWSKEQEWLDIYNQILLLFDQSQDFAYMN